MSDLKQRDMGHQVAPPPTPQGDLDQIRSGMEAMLHRLGQINVKLSYLYGEGESAQVRPTPSGMIIQITSLIEDLSDAISSIEGTVGRL